MRIKKGSEVKFSYRLFSGEEIMDETLPGQPMIYTHGEGTLVPGLEKALRGLKAGDKVEVVVKPEDGYGTIRDDRIVNIPKAKIPKEADVHEGMEVPARSPEGEMVVGIITKVTDETVTIDFNHQLAGKTLRFEVEILEVSN